MRHDLGVPESFVQALADNWVQNLPYAGNLGSLVAMELELRQGYVGLVVQQLRLTFQDDEAATQTLPAPDVEFEGLAMGIIECEFRARLWREPIDKPTYTEGWIDFQVPRRVDTDATAS